MDEAEMIRFSKGTKVKVKGQLTELTVVSNCWFDPTDKQDKLLCSYVDSHYGDTKTIALLPGEVVMADAMAQAMREGSAKEKQEKDAQKNATELSKIFK